MRNQRVDKRGRRKRNDVVREGQEKREAERRNVICSDSRIACERKETIRSNDMIQEQDTSIEVIESIFVR